VGGLVRHATEYEGCCRRFGTTTQHVSEHTRNDQGRRTANAGRISWWEASAPCKHNCLPKPCVLRPATATLTATSPKARDLLTQQVNRVHTLRCGHRASLSFVGFSRLEGSRGGRLLSTQHAHHRQVVHHFPGRNRSRPPPTPTRLARPRLSRAVRAGSRSRCRQGTPRYGVHITNAKKPSTKLCQQKGRCQHRGTSCPFCPKSPAVKRSNDDLNDADSVGLPGDSQRRQSRSAR